MLVQSIVSIYWARLYQVPRALVNLIEPLHILPLREMHLETSLKCPTWLVKWVSLFSLPFKSLTEILSLWKRFYNCTVTVMLCGFDSSSCAPVMTQSSPDYHLINSKTPCYLSSASILCPCVILPKANSKALQMVEDINRGYQVRKLKQTTLRSLKEQALTPSLYFFKHLLHDLVESSRYDTRSDFTVVIQPFFREIIVPKLPVSNTALSLTCGLHRLYGSLVHRTLHPIYKHRFSNRNMTVSLQYIAFCFD